MRFHVIEISLKNFICVKFERILSWSKPRTIIINFLKTASYIFKKNQSCPISLKLVPLERS